MISISKETWLVVAIGAVSGLCSFLVVLFVSKTGTWPLTMSIPGLLFGVSVIVLASIRHRSIRHKVAWVFASWVSFQCAFWFWIAMTSLMVIGSGVLSQSLFHGSVGIIGSIILLIACRVLLGKITKAEIVLSVSLAFLIPAVFIVITDIEESEWFNIPTTYYFLFTMITWQTVALLLIDALARKHAPHDTARVIQ